MHRLPLQLVLLVSFAFTCDLLVERCVWAEQPVVSTSGQQGQAGRSPQASATTKPQATSNRPSKPTARIVGLSKRAIPANFGAQDSPAVNDDDNLLVDDADSLLPAEERSTPAAQPDKYDRLAPPSLSPSHLIPGVRSDISKPSINNDVPAASQNIEALPKVQRSMRPPASSLIPMPNSPSKTTPLPKTSIDSEAPPLERPRIDDPKSSTSAQRGPAALPPAERVVPLPITPAEKGFPGFVPRPNEIEAIPNPNEPPAYDPALDPTKQIPKLEPWRMPTPDAMSPDWMGSTSGQGGLPSIHEPTFVAGVEPAHDPMTHYYLPATDNRAKHVQPSAVDFQPTPIPSDPADPYQEAEAYYGKTAVPTQRPWVEWWRPFYSGGQYPPAIPFPSQANPLTPAFLVYGDYRAGVGVHRDQGRNIQNIATRLNLDMDLRLTGTERIHAFMGPLDHNGRVTRWEFQDGFKLEEELDAQLDTAFFEGDLGAIMGSFRGEDARRDLPFTFGLIPLVYQNGIWMEDAIAGLAFAFPWKHSLPLNWSNFDATFFAGFNQVTSLALDDANDNGRIFGTAWFIDAYRGYIEADYAYIQDVVDVERSHHNLGLAYTRRYFDRVSNSVRIITNMGQSGPEFDRTADGTLLLSENSLITSQPGTVVPYANFFYGTGTPQSAARGANSGGILRNTGINFETDLLTFYPTLNATGSNSYGMATGINLMTADFRRQLVLEFAALDRYGADTRFAPPGAQYALGARFQQALTNWTLIRIDLMSGFLDQAPDIYGSRFEFRWKF